MLSDKAGTNIRFDDKSYSWRQAVLMFLQQHNERVLYFIQDQVTGDYCMTHTGCRVYRNGRIEQAR